jgi:3-dehydroquinate synthase
MNFGGGAPAYPIIVEDGLLDRVGSLVELHAPAHAYAIITDNNVAPLYGARVARSFGEKRVELFTMHAGEAHKTAESWLELSQSLLRRGFARDSAIIALGGGIVGDVAGFVAGTYMRGVPCVQVPTTVVAMVDSSVGGKTGVNTRAGKNLLGVFHNPSAVLVDPGTLATLPLRELRAGMAEALKHGIIADASYFDEVRGKLGEILQSNGATPAMRALIERSISIKSQVVAADERESGLRKILNFGHTVGHAIESLSSYSLLHGEAIAIGMVLECRIAERFGVAEEGTSEIIRAAFEQAGLPTILPPNISAASIVEAAASDKKVRSGSIEFALPRRIGQMAGENSQWTIRIPSPDIQKTLSSP